MMLLPCLVQELHLFSQPLKFQILSYNRSTSMQLPLSHWWMEIPRLPEP